MTITSEAVQRFVYDEIEEKTQQLIDQHNRRLDELNGSEEFGSSEKLPELKLEVLRTRFALAAQVLELSLKHQVDSGHVLNLALNPDIHEVVIDDRAQIEHQIIDLQRQVQ